MIRRVNGDDLRWQTTTPQTALLQALIPSGGVYPTSWPALDAPGQVVTTSADPSICKYQISRIRALNDSTGRYIAMGQAWRYASGGTSGACAASATDLSGTGIRNLLLVAASAADVEAGNWSIGMPYVSSTTLIPNEWDAAQIADGSGDLLALFRTTVSGATVRRQARLRAETGVNCPSPTNGTIGCWVLDQATLGNPGNLQHSGHPELLTTQEGVIIEFATDRVAYTSDGSSWTTLSGFTGGKTDYYPRSIQDSTNGDIYVFGHVGCDDPYAGYEVGWGGRSYTGTPDPVTAPPNGKGCWQSSGVNQSITMQKFRLAVSGGSVPAVTTMAASGISSTGATLNGTVNPNGQATTYYFQYGTTTSYGTNTTSTSAGSGSTAVAESANISGLAPSTLYHFRLVATNATGTTNGLDQSFTTSASGTAPTVVTNPATAITASAATLNGTVNPNGAATTYYYQYGTTTGYGTNTASLSAGSGTAAVSVPVNISGLAASTLYHFRLVASNPTGTTNGLNQSFTTSPSGGTTYVQSVLNSNPVAYWRLGEASGTTAADQKGVNPGTYTNGVVLGAAGAVPGNTAATFDGTNDHVVAADSASLDTGDIFTAEAWIKPSLLGRSNTIVNKFGSYFLYLDGANKIVLYKPSVGPIATSTTGISDTTSFHHVAVTKNGATVKIYLDGVDVTGTVTNRTVVNSTGGLYIGSGGGYFKGVIDEVAIYNTALSASTIAAHYAARNN
ncbi:MAG: LamG domain-containing protein [Acidobacteria bacterium]|nr:LamG domain-containing protein [Acidobacteriota bacterium]